ncbi:DinB family protein [Taibaiella helva]|uniref:DinB family protein n=1 Tax=Taibaiella helva TaxID=2301235 RepID=UPI000E56ED89|nr:DinB family protein [Taibaiella helva]
MIVKTLLGEFLHEAENTRRLLKAIPDSALGWKPAEHSWTTAQLASHIAEIYNWYPVTLQQKVFDMGNYRYDKGDISNMATIVAKFEENVSKAQEALQSASEESMMETWRMEREGQLLMPELPRAAVARGFLMNHLYHHRGEMIVYLRSTGNRVPGLYGPVWEDRQS